MKIALATTTIHVPHVLNLFRACSSDVRFYVATDKQTPVICHGDITARNVFYVPGGDWKCSELIGWNTLARRNIAFLAALSSGADVIVSIDDDNMPVNGDYFWNIDTKIMRPFNGLSVAGHSHWFDPGSLLIPNAKQRGIPHGNHAHFYSPVTNARIGVMAGLVLGNSDVDATTRLEVNVDTHVVSELARAGLVVSHCTHTVFNTQNVAVIRELVPAWFLLPDVGRMDDIYASLIVKRVARDRGLHIHYGQPFVYQQRHEHDLIKDLRAEIDGYENVSKLADLLDHTQLKGQSVLDDVRTIYDTLRATSFINLRQYDAAVAYLADCEQVLG